MKRLMASGVLMVVLAAGARRRRRGRACTWRPRSDSLPIASGRTWRTASRGRTSRRASIPPPRPRRGGGRRGRRCALGAGGGAALGAASGGSAGRGEATGAVLGGVVAAWPVARSSTEVQGGIRPRICLMHWSHADTRRPRRGDGSTAAAPGAGGGRAAAAADRRRPRAAARPRDSRRLRRGRAPTRAHPAGHSPPAGYCRLWYPGRPPGQQRIRFPATRRTRFPRARSSSTRASPGTVTTTGVRPRAPAWVGALGHRGDQRQALRARV